MARGIILLLYFDEVVITNNDLDGMHQLKHSLIQKFDMKDVGFLSYFLGLEVSSNAIGYYLY